MPIGKAVWESSEPANSIRTELTEFLKANQSLAYTDRELSDELFGSKWAEIHEEERQIAHIGEEAYRQQNPEPEPDLANRFFSRERVNQIWNILDDLVHEGVVEMRPVPGEKTDIPDAPPVVPCYTYSAEETR
jgi:hypothetical protein